MNSNKNIFFDQWRIIFLISAVLFAGCSSPEDITDLPVAGRAARMEPDYSGVLIPPNIAPMNFSIKEPGRDYFVRIRSKKGDPVIIQNSSGKIQIPLKYWRTLLKENIGENLILDICVKDGAGQWMRFDSVVNRISTDSVDSFLSYRRFNPLFNLFKKMGIYQRHLENFDEEPILLNRLTSDNCMNCHNFLQNGTNRWLLQLRGAPATAMLLVIDGKVKRIDTKTKFNGPTAYPAWHPSGSLIAFSVSKLHLFFHQTGETRDVIDESSDIVLYDIPTNTITTVPEISSKDQMEIWPAWSPDGKFLYYCSTPAIEGSIKSLMKPDNPIYKKIKYDLMRISYDIGNNRWGKPETVISSGKSGLSITEPRVSPDGRYVLFTAASYSQFPIYIPDADIYLFEIKSGKWKKLEANSNQTDTFHSWSSNGRWIVFSSRRRDGLFTMPYFSHIDSAGNSTKPFVMPQEDPSFFESCLEVYNVPELTREPVTTNPQLLAKTAFSDQDAITANLDPGVTHRAVGDKVETAKKLK